jgi:sulfite exporter TauE/SafE
MITKLFTCFQIFGLGLSFGMAGPCLFSCAPLLVAYLTARQLKLGESLGNILVFSFGRLLAYIFLGFLAGLSASALRHLNSGKFILMLRPLAALLIIGMGISVILNKDSPYGFCRLIKNKASGLTGLFVLGLIVGISPCAPLLALLFEIGLISHHPWQAMIYVLCFGLGTLISALLIIGGLTGIFSWLPLRLLSSKKANLVFRVICASIIVLMGLKLFFY